MAAPPTTVCFARRRASPLEVDERPAAAAGPAPQTERPDFIVLEAPGRGARVASQPPKEIKRKRVAPAPAPSTSLPHIEQLDDWEDEEPEEEGADLAERLAEEAARIARVEEMVPAFADLSLDDRVLVRSAYAHQL